MPTPTPPAWAPADLSWLFVTYFCCDASQTPGVDEGLEDDWTAASEAAIDRALVESNGAVNAIGIRHTCGAGGQTTDAQLRASALAIEDRGLVVVLGCEDRWCGRHEELGGDSCGITPEHVRRNEHNACQADRVRRCVAIVDGIERAFIELGNELPLDTRTGSFATGVIMDAVTGDSHRVAAAYDLGVLSFDQMVTLLPQEQPDLRAHEEWVGTQVLRWRPEAQLVTNAVTLAEPGGKPIRWLAVHGDPTVADPSVFPAHPIGPRTFKNESRNQFTPIEREIDSAQYLVDRGAGIGWWRGVHTREEAAERLDAMSRVKPRPTPTPGPDPVCVPDIAWSPVCPEPTANDDLHGAAVDAAIRRVLATGEWPSRVPEPRWIEYTSAVAAELRAAELCAVWGAPPQPDRRKGSEDEVGVWGPGDARREQFDLLAGAGDVPFRHYAAVCGKK